MKTIKDVIETAIRGGWEEPWDMWDEDGDVWSGTYVCVLDPLFWQALGKGLGWDMVSGQSDYSLSWTKNTWEYYIHQMTDHLIDGVTVEEYLISLLPQCGWDCARGKTCKNCDREEINSMIEE